MNCPLCLVEIDDRALVCSSCGRDIALPPELLTERAMLFAKRDDLKDQLADVQSRIALKRRQR